MFITASGERRNLRVGNAYASQDYFDALGVRLIGINRSGPLSYAAAFVLMMAIAAAAGLAAAWQVRRVSPLEALRAE